MFFSKFTCFPTLSPPGIHIISHPTCTWKPVRRTPGLQPWTVSWQPGTGMMCLKQLSFLTQQKGHWAGGKRIVLKNVDVNLGVQLQQLSCQHEIQVDVCLHWNTCVWWHWQRVMLCRGGILKHVSQDHNTWHVEIMWAIAVVRHFQWAWVGVLHVATWAASCWIPFPGRNDTKCVSHFFSSSSQPPVGVSLVGDT